MCPQPAAGREWRRAGRRAGAAGLLGLAALPEPYGSGHFSKGGDGCQQEKQRGGAVKLRKPQVAATRIGVGVVWQGVGEADGGGIRARV